MAKYDFDLIVIGGGAAGLTVTAGAAQLGAKTLLIEKEPNLGGDCLHYGCVPSKTLIRTARLYHQMRRGPEFGLPQVEVPPVEFAKVRDRIRHVINTIQKHDSPERFCSLGAKVIFGYPEFVDEHSISVEGKIYSGKKICIATGSGPMIPPITGIKDVSYHTNKTIFFMDKLPKELTILGGGAIAIEMAQAFSRLGSKVTVIQRSERILKNEDPDFSEEIKGILEEEGVKFFLGTKIKSITPIGGGVRVDIGINETGDDIAVQSDAILIALGRKPNIDGLLLEKAGVDFDKQGIKVDDRLRTTQKHIYAAGDVIGKYQFTHAAGYEGGIVVTNAVFRIPRKVDYTYMPRCTYTDPEFACIGMNESQCKASGTDYELFEESFDRNDRAICEGAERGEIKLLLDKSGTPLGIQILGSRAGDLLSYWVVGLKGRVKTSTLAQAVHPYPTFGEINKRVVGAFISKKVFSDRVKKGLKFFFNLKGRACG
ncbi:Mercuric ion reductase [Dissulfuribacter thermophilus]|uniref:Mercuric ion reductase n=1 Tax=Dissulfuribacter thermophilus TaxID=1156395 RepID=A0A1B9F3E8_9BACT|nr:FAD-dependent oxidoreductase [Dissulfuribacter thermophilus]OCC14291.1 Mercuric ion reductase [Dissulfuribacter thermophilus]